MPKKWVDLPDAIRKSLNERIQARYIDLIKELPRFPLGQNPSITHEVSKEGFTAEVRFHFLEGKYSTSLWEYKYITGNWHMYQDWKD